MTRTHTQSGQGQEIFGQSPKEEMLERLKEWAFNRMCSTSKAGIDAYVYGGLPDEEGNYPVSGTDSTGRAMAGKLKYEDSQAIDEARPELAKSTTTVERACSDIARDSTASTTDRIAALGEWMATHDDDVSAFIIAELCRMDLAEDWRNALVYAAENATFKKPEDQARVCSRLRELALELRETTKTGTEHVVWSAIRRLSSLIPSEDANGLLAFLDRKGRVDTRMVALQCVARVFQNGPPSGRNAVEPLERRVAEYAEKFLDPDVFESGENSSIARNAVLALAALGSPRLEGCMSRVDALGKRWLSRRIRHQLQELLDSWKAHGVESEKTPAMQVVERALATVRTIGTG